MLRRTVIAALPVLTAASLTAGCGSDTSRCETTGAAADVIASKLVPGATYTGRASAVMSRDFSKVWMVILEFHVNGKPQTGIWAADDLESPTGIFSVDAYAHNFSTWLRGQSVDAHVDVTNDGFDQVKNCLD